MPSLLPKSTIYVIDDDLDVLGSLRFLLETEGFEVRTFRNATAVLGPDTAGDVDCFVIDYKMPNMDGIDLASRLRDRNITTPIILITGYPDENIPAKAAAAGLNHVLLKPHLEESLVAHIRQAMQERLAAG
jgi:FixJ family two-component response regulator